MSAVGLILFLGACAGHTALLIYALNWAYGTPTSRKLLTTLRHTLAVLGVAGPLLLALALGPDLSAADALAWPAPARAVMGVYLCLCWAVAFVVLPVLTVRRLLHRPAALVSNHTRTVDVARQLGHRPVGRGKYERLARLPGNEIFRVDFAERTLRLPRLPAAWDGLTVLHLSDLHLSGTPDRAFYEYVADACRAWEPDLVALTGDFIDTGWHHRWVIPVLGRLRWRLAAFAVLGNHDAWYQTDALVRRRLRRLGIHVLGNGWLKTEVRGEPLVVVGHEGPWYRPEPDLAGCQEGPFRLCLSHTPDNYAWARRHGMDLVLAGHNHGGQIRFPVIGSVLVPSRYGRRYDCGTFCEGGTVMHVSRGLGGQHPLRYGCRPEVTKLVLRVGQ